MRAFGLEISANIQTSHGNQKELIIEERAAIVATRRAGVPCHKLAKDFNCHILTITCTVQHFTQCKTLKSNPRTGRPEKLNR